MKIIYAVDYDDPMRSEEAAKYLNISVKKLYRLVKENKIKAHRVPGLKFLYFFRSELKEAWLKENGIVE